MDIKLDEVVVDRAQDFRVHRHVYTSPGIFDAEMERLFHRNWAYVGHESEVPRPGDYKTAYVGRYPVILSRSEDGTLHVLLNRCMHRGAVVCREDRGHANHFRCVYHNWVYQNDGTLVGAAQSSGYPADFADESKSLVRAARVEAYRGLVFASFNADVEPLATRLQHVARYIDAWADRSPEGRISLPRGCHRYEYPGNWKLQIENGVDGYHGNYVHESFTKILERAGQQSRKDVHRARNAVQEGNHAKGLPRGDALLERKAGTLGTFDYTSRDDYRAQLHAAHGEDRFEDILTQRNILIFPNVMLFESHVRVIRPVSIDSTIVDNYPTWLEGVPDELNTERLREHERFFGPASFGATDDIEIFVQVQTGLKGEPAEWLDFSRGLNRETTKGQECVGHSTDENPQRAIYRGWSESMAEADVV